MGVRPFVKRVFSIYRRNSRLVADRLAIILLWIWSRPVALLFNLQMASVISFVVMDVFRARWSV